MTLMEAIQKQEQDPKFAASTYEEQLRWRSALLNYRLPKEQSFIGLTMKQRQLAYKTLLYREPVFVRPTKDLQESVDLITKKIDPEYGLTSAFTASPEKKKQVTKIRYLYMINFLRKFNKESVLAEGIWKGAKKIADTLLPGTAEKWQTDRDDLGKLISYMDYTADEDKKLRRIIGPISALSGIAATAADLYVMYKATTAAGTQFFAGLTAPSVTPQLAMKAMLGKAALPNAGGLFSALSQSRVFVNMTKVAPKTSRILQGLVRTAGPGTAHAIADGFIGVVRENLHDNLLKGMTNLSTQEVLNNSVKYFSEYALGDLLFFVAGKTLKNFAGTAGRYISGAVKKRAALTELDSVMGKLLRMDALDPVWFARQDKTTQEMLRQTQAVMKTFSKVERLTPEDAFKVFSGSKGFLALPQGDKWRMVSLLDDGLKGTFASIEDAVKWVNKNVDMAAMKQVGYVRAIDSAAMKQATLKRSLKIRLPQTGDNALKALTEAIAPVGGKFTSEGVETYAKGFLKAGGIDETLLQKVNVSKVGDNLVVKLDDSILAQTQMAVLTPVQETTFVQNLTNKLNDLLPGEKVKLPSYVAQLKQKALYTNAWVEDYIKRQGGIVKQLDDGSFIATVHGQQIEAMNYNEIGDSIVRQFVKDDPATLARHLANHYGLHLKGSMDAGYYLQRGRKKITDSFKTLDDLMQKHPEFLPRVPSELGPRGTLVNNATEIKYHQGVLAGETSDILTELSKFRDTKRTGKVVRYRGTNVISAGNEYELSIPNLGYKETFSSIRDVDKFLQKGLYEKIEYIAPRKGFILSSWGDQLHLTTEGGKTYVANSLDEAAALLSEKGIMPEWAPELTGVDAQMMAAVNKIPGFSFKPSSHTPVPDKALSAGQLFSALYRAPDQFFRKALRKGVKGSDEVMKQFRRLEDARDVMVGISQKFAPVIDDIFKFPNGKALNKTQRRHITQMGEIDPSKWDDFITRYKLKPEMKSVAQKLRNFYGENADSALYKYMGNDPNLFLKDYMPRIREYVNTGQMSRYVDTDVNPFLADAFGNQVPSGVDVFFQHARVSDLVDMAREMDAKVLLQKYVVLGNRKKFISPIIEEINNWAGTVGNRVDSALMKRFGAYLNDIAGIPSTLNEKLAQDYTERLFSELKLGKHIAAKNITEVIMGTSYVTTMGWRAWLPARNSFQIWSTFAPRLGNSWTSRALSKLNADKAGDIYKTLQRKGIITAGLPVGGADLFKSTDAVAKITKSSLAAYKNSDSFTRAVAHTATKMRFDDAVSRMRKGLLNQAEFINASGMYNLAEDRLSQALKLIDSGQVDAAGDLFARDMVMETMFPYRAGTSPLLFRGVIGKMFGQMGHYPVYWIENIRRGVGRGNTAQKLAYITRFLGNTSAIAGALTAVGISGQNFLPWSPAQFTGGPWYDLINDGIQLWGGGYEGKQARAKILGIKTKDGKPYWDAKVLKNNIGSALSPVMLRSLTKAADYINQGDYYRSIMSLASVPLLK